MSNKKKSKKNRVQKGTVLKSKLMKYLYYVLLDSGISKWVNLKQLTGETHAMEEDRKQLGQIFCIKSKIS